MHSVLYGIVPHSFDNNCSAINAIILNFDRLLEINTSRFDKR